MPQLKRSRGAGRARAAGGGGRRAVSGGGAEGREREPRGRLGDWVAAAIAHYSLGLVACVRLKLWIDSSSEGEPGLGLSFWAVPVCCWADM